MRFQEIDDRMRRFETINDPVVRPDMYYILRMDGKGFTSMCRDMKLIRPFDPRFASAMQEAAKAFLQHDSFKAVYSYVQSDEISVLLPKTLAFNGKIRKFNSIGASLATVVFNKNLDSSALFDCRVIELPTEVHVNDYFRWRQADADRNCLNTTLHWNLILKSGLSGTKAAKMLFKKSVGEKYQMLDDLGINYDTDIHSNYRYGTSYAMGKVMKTGYNPYKNEYVQTERSRIIEVPVRQDVIPLGLGTLRDA